MKEERVELPPIPLITTTVRTGHNAGDTFIGVGLQYLFERALGPQRWVLIDRFSPKGFRANEAIVRAAPFLVYGGMPQYNNYDEWIHWYDDRMWRDYLLRWGLKVFTMAGGAGFSHPNIGIEEYVDHCLRSRKTRRIILQRVDASLCFTVRDPYAHALLNALDIPNRYLPCSATWASRMWRIEPAENRPYLFLVPPPVRYVRRDEGGRRRRRSERRRRFAEQWDDYYRALREYGGEVKVLCHGLDEYEALRGTIPPEDLWYHGDSYTLLCQYAAAHTVVSARLHGSLPAFGIPGTRVVNLSVDVRGSAVERFPKIRNVRIDRLDAGDLPALLHGLDHSSEEDLAEWESAYVETIRESLPDGDLSC